MGENYHLWSFSKTCTGTGQPVPVQFGFWSFLANLYRYMLELYRYSLGSGRFWPTYTGTGQTCTSTPCSILTSVCILAITCSFLIRFELFKWIIKLDFKENETSRNRPRQLLTLSGPNIHSKWGYILAKFCFIFDHRVVRIVSDVS